MSWSVVAGLRHESVSVLCSVCVETCTKRPSSYPRPGLADIPSPNPALRGLFYGGVGLLQKPVYYSVSDPQHTSTLPTKNKIIMHAVTGDKK